MARGESSLIIAGDDDEERKDMTVVDGGVRNDGTKDSGTARERQIPRVMTLPFD